MNRPTKTWILIPFVLLMYIGAARAQSQQQPSGQETCEGPVYPAQALSRRAKITNFPAPSFTEEARTHDVRGTIVVKAILCRTGRITNLQVIKSLPHGMTERALEAVRQVKFTPAEKDGSVASQWQIFEMNFNGDDLDAIDAKDAAGRLIEELIITGNRRFTQEEILRRIQTRVGEPFSQSQVSTDLEALIETGYFDPRGTRVTLSDGVRGGVVVAFEVHELPLINEVKFQGLKDVGEEVILDAFRKENLDLQKGAICDPAKVRIALPVIKKTLESHGRGKAHVEILVENLTSTSVNLIFVITQAK